jgi:hypothetical protein
MSKKLTWKDYFNLSNIKNFASGYWNKLRDDSHFMSLQPHVKEQVLYRMNLCRECYVNGSCLECGCKTPEMFYAVAKVDSKERWGKMLSAKEWEEFKINNELNALALTTFIVETNKEKKDDAKRQNIPDEGGSTLPKSSGDQPARIQKTLDSGQDNG